MIAASVSIASTLAATTVPSAAQVEGRDPRRVLIVADSVALGAQAAVHRAFPDRPVEFLGFPAIWTDVAAKLVRERPNLVGDTVVLATGYNYPFFIAGRFDWMIDTMMTTLREAGAKHVVWMLLRESTLENSPKNATKQVKKYSFMFPLANSDLRRALERHGDLSLVDWVSLSRAPGFTYDAIHLNTAGANAYAAAMRSEVDRVERGDDLAARVLRSQLRPIATPTPSGPDPCSGTAFTLPPTWSDANDAFWQIVLTRGDATWFDPDLDFIPCEQLIGASDQPIPPARSGRTRRGDGGSGGRFLDLFGSVIALRATTGDGTTRDRPLTETATSPVAVSMTRTTTGAAWVLASDGMVRSVAETAGEYQAIEVGRVERSALAPGDRFVAIVGSPSRPGAWAASAAGRVFAVGDAPHYGDLAEHGALRAPIVGAASTPSGQGYWLVAADGGVFAFGDATFEGSTGGLSLDSPIVAILPDAEGRGYWLVAADGGVFAFGAPFLGSLGGLALVSPVIGGFTVRGGYVLGSRDGGTFSFGEAPFPGGIELDGGPAVIALIAPQSNDGESTNAQAVSASVGQCRLCL